MIQITTISEEKFGDWIIEAKAKGYQEYCYSLPAILSPNFHLIDWPKRLINDQSNNR